MKPVSDLNYEKEFVLEWYPGMCVWIVWPQTWEFGKYIFLDYEIQTPGYGYRVEDQQLRGFIEFSVIYFGEVEFPVDPLKLSNWTIWYY
jgi:hypothetical protein